MKIKQNAFFIVLLLIICLSTKAQKKDDFHLGYNYIKDPLTRGKLDVILGYQRINNNTFEIGIASGHRGYEGYGYVYGNYHLTTEHNYNSDKYCLGTKLGYKLSVFLFDFTGQVIYYTDFDKSNIAFRPEIGLTFLGILDLNYGYNLMTDQDNLKQFEGHLVALRFTFGKGIQSILKSIVF